MKTRLFTGMALTATLLLMAGTAMAAIKNPSPHRKVDSKGIGNCVFSTSELSFKKDSSYQLTTALKAPEEVHVRCYFPDELQKYTTVGKVANGMRDTDEYWTSLMVKGTGGLFVIDRGRYGYAGNEDWEQQRFDIDGSADGDFGLDESEAKVYGALNKHGETSEYSINMANYVKAMAESATPKKYPYTANFCMDVYTDMADTVQTETKYDEYGKKWVTKEVPQMKSYIISRGCFDYTINSASDVSWSPASESSNSTPTTNTVKTPEEQAKDLIKGLGF